MLNKRSFSTAWWRKAIPVPRAAAPGKLVEFWDELQRPSDEKYKKRIYRECEYAFVHASRGTYFHFWNIRTPEICILEIDWLARVAMMRRLRRVDAKVSSLNKKPATISACHTSKATRP